MSTKRELLANPLGCLGKAAPDEPVFLLRAKDPLAAQAVRLWAAMAGPAHSAEKVRNAHEIADQMDAWRRANFPAAAAPKDST